MKKSKTEKETPKAEREKDLPPPLRATGENKLILDLPEAAYHADAERMSKHTLDAFCANPWKFMMNQRPDAPERETTSAQSDGRAVHAMILTPDVFERDYVVMPEEIKQRRGKAWDEFAAANAGKEIIAKKTFDLGVSARAALESNRDAAKALGMCALREVSAHWECGGVRMKSRFDAMSKSGKIVLDLKTCQSADADAFMRDANEYGYDVQAAMYLDALAACGKAPQVFVFVCVEKTYPFATGVYIFSDGCDFIASGRAAYREALADYAALMKDFSAGKMREMPGYETQIDLAPVAWSKRYKALRAAREQQTADPLLFGNAE